RSRRRRAWAECSGPDQRPYGLLERAHRGQYRGGLVSAVGHTVAALDVSAVASVLRPIRGLHQLAIALAVAVGLQVTGTLPAEDRITRDPPRRALVIDLALQEVQEQR